MLINLILIKVKYRSGKSRYMMLRVIKKYDIGIEIQI